jgi:carboxypeptidase C (cathepsin A)
MTEYLTTLAGAPPQGERARAFYARVAEVSGLPLEVVTKTRGFVTKVSVKDLRPGKVVSRYDVSFAVDDPYPERRSERAPDPILDSLTRAYGGGMANYARSELGFKTSMTYHLLANEVTRNWDWQGGRINASVEDELRVLFAYTPSFRLMVAHGVADMVTPHAMSRYVLDHLPPAESPGRTSLKLYRGGHMFYLDEESRREFSRDAGAFYRGGE